MPTFFSGFPSCFRIAPVPQPTSRTFFLRQSGNSDIAPPELSHQHGGNEQRREHRQKMVLVDLGTEHKKGERLICCHKKQRPPIPTSKNERKHCRRGKSQESGRPKAH